MLKMPLQKNGGSKPRASIAGPLKGSHLPEVPSHQASLDNWLKRYPHSLVMQPDSTFAKEYEQLSKYDKGIGKSSLTKRDSASWMPKSWVIGVKNDKTSKAYDWNELVGAGLDLTQSWSSIWITWKTYFNLSCAGQNCKGKCFLLKTGRISD